MPIHFGGLRSVREFYEEAGSRFAAGAGGFINLGSALGHRARHELTRPNQVILSQQDKKAISFQGRGTGTIRPGLHPFIQAQGNLKTSIKTIKKNIERRKRLKKRLKFPLTRRIGR